MAPKGSTKRTASSSGGRTSSAKKAKKAVSVSAKISSVTNELEASTLLPEAVRGLLAKMLPKCLCEVKDKRHAFQTQIIDKVGVALAEIEASLKAEVAAAQVKVDGAEHEKASRAASQTATQEILAKKQEVVSQRKAELAESQSTVKASKEKLSASKAAQTKGDAELEKASATKEKLEAAFTNTYMKMRDGTSDEELGGTKNKEKMLSAFIRMLGREFHVDKTMLETLPVALSRDAASRGHFDGVVLSHIEAEVQKLLQGFQDTLTTGEPDKLARAAAVNTAGLELEQSMQAKSTCEGNLEAAKVEEKEADSSANVASKSVEDFESDLADAKATLEDATGCLSELTDGPLASFLELRDRETPPPPAPEPEPAAKPEAAMAPAGAPVSAP